MSDEAWKMFLTGVVIGSGISAMVGGAIVLACFYGADALRATCSMMCGG